MTLTTRSNHSPKNSNSLPETFELFDVTDAEFKYGVQDESKYLDRFGGQYALTSHKWNARASTLLFTSDTLEDIGLRIKPGLDEERVMRAIRALLRSFAPVHDVKTATVGFALMHWCEEIPAE